MDKLGILDEAKRLISTDRVRDYGTPKENFGRIAKLWSVILGTPITPAQVALCMIAIKVTRLMKSDQHKDSWVDIAGYAGCGGEASQKGSTASLDADTEHKSISKWGMHGV